MQDYEVYSFRAYMITQQNKIREKDDHSTDIKTIDGLIHKMNTIESYISEKYYPVIDRLYPWFTSHGEKHIYSILNMLAEMLYRNHVSIAPLDFFMLYLATIYHDTGMVSSRGRHAEEIKPIIQDLSGYIKSREVEQTILQIAQAHSGPEEKIDTLPNAKMISYDNRNRRHDIRALASLLRFVDEVSETVDRIDSTLLYDHKVPVENEIYWQYANCIKSSSVTSKPRSITMRIEIEKDTIFKSFPYIKKDGSKNDIVFLDYLFERLDKMNEERKLCCINFRSFAEIDSIDISLAIVDVDGNTIKIYGGDGGEKKAEFEIQLNERLTKQESISVRFYEQHPEFSKKEALFKRE